jgi:hypothetical protein
MCVSPQYCKVFYNNTSIRRLVILTSKYFFVFGMIYHYTRLARYFLFFIKGYGCSYFFYFIFYSFFFFGAHLYNPLIQKNAPTFFYFALFMRVRRVKKRDILTSLKDKHRKCRVFSTEKNTFRLSVTSKVHAYVDAILVVLTDSIISLNEVNWMY